MKAKSFLLLIPALFLAAPPVLRAADAAPDGGAIKPATNASATTTIAATDLFGDDVLCKGKGVDVRQSAIQKAYDQYLANVAARGGRVTDEERPKMENMMLDRIVVSQLLLSRATDEDRAKAKIAADKFIDNAKQQAGSEDGFRRQLIAMGFTTQDFSNQVLERAVAEEVIDRVLRSQVKITDETVQKYYTDNPDKFTRKEMVRASHVLLSTRDPITGQEVTEDQKKEKRALADKVRDRALAGEDFAALAKAYSEDPGSKDKGGEYLFGRGQMVPEFELAAFSLKTNEVSDVVVTKYGYHVIKLLQVIPPEKIEFDKIKEELRGMLAREEVQEKLMPVFFDQIKDEAKLEYFNGAQPPPRDQQRRAQPKP